MKRLLRLFFALVLLLIVAGVTMVYALPRWNAVIPADGVTLTVVRGASLSRVAAELQKLGVAPSWVVSAAGRIRGSGNKLRAGQYLLNAPQTVEEILEIIESGAAIQVPVTVVEGSKQSELFALLKTLSTEAKQFAPESVKPPNQWAQLVGAETANLEGYLFPDTYFVAPGSNAATLLSTMHKRMRQELALAWEQRAPDTPLKSPYEALILASIIEKETAREADRPLVGSVFINRMNVGMRLQTDPTVIYGLGEAFDGNLRKIHLQTDTPYNSYTRDGLPPTPIAYPGRASLRAAVNPPKSEFLYFVARGDGSSEFSRNLAEHNRAVAKYQLGR
ncbi:MAG: endolytic transglycosylase MltG [Betaproteobacteria bacterium]|nr:MAG: endolytic transglycosylase MltG [Betaproteobacteria bacterium]